MYQSCEAVSLDIKALLDIHPDWVVLHMDVENTFNIVSHASIFRKFKKAGGLLLSLIPFAHSC
ncbi:hypothetical protein Mapa_013347 [Marchantia paleacea]|nr:hypothetical protein Mapa_013347 [Marchantia paleacea]